MSNLNFTIMKIRTKIKFVCVMTLLAAAFTTMSAQTKSDLKAVKSEVKDLKKEGWKTTPGGLSIADQLALARPIQVDQDKWIVGGGMSRGSFYDAAKNNALFEAKKQIAANVIKIAGDQDEGIINEQGEIVSAGKFKDRGKGIYERIINDPKTLVEIYRYLPDGNVEVSIRIAIPKEQAMTSYERVKKELEEMMKQ